MQDIGQTTVMLFGNALDPRGRTNHPKPASTRPHGNQMGTVLAKDKQVWRPRYNETLITGRTRPTCICGAPSTHLESVAAPNTANPLLGRAWRAALARHQGLAWRGAAGQQTRIARTARQRISNPAAAVLRRDKNRAYGCPGAP